jgi:hypothetical protein
LSAVAPPAVKWRGTLVVLVLIVLAAGIAQTSAGHSLMRKAGLFEQPATYTSLAFQHPQSLPQLSSARADVPVSFVISNVGNTPHTYQWILSLAQGSLDRRVATGSIRLAPGNRAVLTRTAHVDCTQQRVNLVVSLAHPAESIHAWATCPAPTPSSS